MNRRQFFTTTPLAAALAAGTLPKKIEIKERKFDYLNGTLFLPDNAPEPKDMGISEHPAKTHVFTRKFRFLLQSNKEPTARWWCTTLDVDFTKKTLMPSFYDCAEIRQWLDKLGFNEVLTLSVLDGTGATMWAAKFTGLKLLEQKVNFDMSDSGELRQNVVISFTKHNRKDYWKGSKKNEKA